MCFNFNADFVAWLRPKTISFETTCIIITKLVQGITERLGFKRKKVRKKIGCEIKKNSNEN